MKRHPHGKNKNNIKLVHVKNIEQSHFATDFFQCYLAHIPQLTYYFHVFKNVNLLYNTINFII